MWCWYPYLGKFVQDEIDVPQVDDSSKQRGGHYDPQVVTPREEVHRGDDLFHAAGGSVTTRMGWRVQVLFYVE